MNRVAGVVLSAAINVALAGFLQWNLTLAEGTPQGEVWITELPASQEATYAQLSSRELG